MVITLNKGTAILLNDDQTVTCIEDVERSMYKEMKELAGCTDYHIKMGDREICFADVQFVFWCANDVDWDYGY